MQSYEYIKMYVNKSNDLKVKLIYIIMTKYCMLMNYINTTGFSKTRHTMSINLAIM